jgi:integrase
MSEGNVEIVRPNLAIQSERSPSTLRLSKHCAGTAMYRSLSATSQAPFIRIRISCSLTRSDARSTRRRLGERFVRARKAAGIPTGTLHILRHTSAALALTAIPPVPLHVVAACLGHDPKTVLATYAHLLPHSDAMAAEAVAAAIVDKPLTTELTPLARTRQ